ncbi:MAG: hypothetical protein QXO51_03625 [Halobacteria archaeon]
MRGGWKAVERLHRRFERERDLEALRDLVRRAREAAESLDGVERTRAGFYLARMERDLRKWEVLVRRGAA